MYQYTLKGLGYCHILHSVCFYLPKIVHVYAFLNLVQFYMYMYVQDLGTLNFSVFQKRLVNTVTICMVYGKGSHKSNQQDATCFTKFCMKLPKVFYLAVCSVFFYMQDTLWHMQIKRNLKSLMFCDSFSRMSTELYNVLNTSFLLIKQMGLP